MFVLAALINASCVKAQPAPNSDVNRPTTISLNIPSSIMFCGEKISLERYDMRERYDREQFVVVAISQVRFFCLTGTAKSFTVLNHSLMFALYRVLVLLRELLSLNFCLRIIPGRILLPR